LSGLYEAVLNIPKDPVVNGYKFIGWNKTDLKIFGPESKTITACWDVTGNTSYTIREYLQSVEGGNNYSLDKEYQKTGSVSSFSPGTKTGFELHNKELLHIDSDGNAFINVYWNRLSYTVTFDTLGGSTIPKQHVLYEAHVQMPQNPDKPDYTFYSWYTDSSLESLFTPSMDILQDTTLYAFWIDNSITYEFHETVTRLGIGSTDGTAGTSGEYVLFGDYPQSLLSDNTVTFEETKKMKMGDLTVYLGSDENVYAKKYNRYYKIEPIKWRVISRDENNIAVLLAEKILDFQCFSKNNSKDLYAGSDIRSFLNEDFLSRAFTSTAQNLIAITEIDSYPANIITYDKIYLLKYTYLNCVSLNNTSVFPNALTRQRVYTSFSNPNETCGEYWTRELSRMGDFVTIRDDGGDGRRPYYNSMGVVPALSIYLPPEN